MKRCTISVYHWQVVVYLAWMSSGTHLITLSVLRKHLRRKRILRVTRVVGMLILFVMLVIAITPTTNQTFFSIILGGLPYWWSAPFVDESPPLVVSDIPSACFWNRRYWFEWRWDAALTYLFLISGYVSRAGALFESSEAFFTRNIRNRLLGILEKALDRIIRHLRGLIAHRVVPSRIQRLPYHLYLFTYAVTLACLELYSSFLAPLLWVLLSLVWGSLQLLIPRRMLADEGIVVEENKFEFGQIMPLMLLALPLVGALEACYGWSNTVPPNRI